jgi:chemotaxis signal transduction protein
MSTDVSATPGLQRAGTDRAQAVRCGERWFAFAYGWARSAVESFEISAVPNAPAWLVGAANVDGRIVPVVDLLAWSAPGRWQETQGRHARLLVGGEGEAAIALLFQGLPRLVAVRPGAAADPNEQLAPLVRGQAVEDPAIVALDGPALVHVLTDELALR